MASHHARLLRSVARAATTGPREGLLLVTNNFSTGGAQSSARRLLLELRRRGVRVRAAVIQEQPAHPTPGRRALEAAGVPVLAVPPPEDLEPEIAVTRILDAVEEDPPQTVVFWNAIVEHKVLLADALFDVAVFDVSPGEMYFASLERYFTRPRRGLPYATPADYGARLASVVVKYAAEAATARDLLHAPVTVIPNGIEAQEPVLPGPGNGPIALGTLARLDPRKRVDRLLHALRLAAPRLPPHRLRIAGGAEPGAAGHMDELRRLGEGLEVEFVGEVETRAFLSGLDVFALVAEPAGCPNASLEAMACGIPVVATDAGGMREQIVDGISGRLVPREDTQALARALVEVCADAEARRRLGEGGRQRVRERFSLRAMADKYVEVLLGTRP
jgi:glycosyltransferase involved in cell wall biosynthesis